MQNPRDPYLPHWLWAVCFILLPLCLTAVGFLGLVRESAIPLSVAELAPQLAVVVSLVGMAAAVLRRRATTLAIAGIGLAASAAGLLLLRWLA